MTFPLPWSADGAIEKPADRNICAIHSALATTLGAAFATVASRLALVPVQDHLEPAGTLLKAERLCSLLEEGRHHHPQASRQERASAWMRAYFRVLLPAVVAPAFAGIRMDGGIANCRIGLRIGQPVALAFAMAPAVGVRINVEDIYGPLLADHAERAVRTAYAATGLSPRIAWSHAGRTLADLFGQFDPLPTLAEAVETHRLVVFGVPANAWFPVNNPLFHNPCPHGE